MSSKKRIEANRRNAQKSTGPRTPEGKTRSAQNATTHGLSSLNYNPLAPGCFLHIEDETKFLGLLNQYVADYRPQRQDEIDLLTEAVYTKWKQQRLWLAETAHLEVTIARNERDFRKILPNANAPAHLANAIGKSGDELKLYLRYDAHPPPPTKSRLRHHDRRPKSKPLQSNPNSPPKKPASNHPEHPEPASSAAAEASQRESHAHPLPLPAQLPAPCPPRAPARNYQPGLLAARPAHLPPRHRQLRHQVSAVLHAAVLPWRRAPVGCHRRRGANLSHRQKHPGLCHQPDHPAGGRADVL